MTIGSLWLPSLGGPPSYTPSNTPTLKSANGGTATAGTVTLPATTATNDCIVLGLQGTATSVTVSGAGATWVLIPITDGGRQNVIAIGYGCTSGATTVSVSGSSSLQWNCSIWGNVRTNGNPVAQTTSASATAPTITSASVSFIAHQVVISMNWENGDASATIVTSYSSGDTSNLIHNTGSGSIQTQSSYITPGSPPGSTTVTANATTGSPNWDQTVIVLHGS